jgi:hypothetical protein
MQGNKGHLLFDNRVSNNTKAAQYIVTFTTTCQGPIYKHWSIYQVTAPDRGAC